jgi:hypothetical protein
MVNPARELVTMLDAWAIPGGRASLDVRETFSREAGSTLEEQHLRACGYLRDISTWIERLSTRIDVDPYRRAVPRWHAAVFAFETGWSVTTGNARRAISPPDRDLLIGLSNTIDLSGAALGITPASLPAVHKAIEDAEAFVNGADITSSLRHHLLGLLAAIREAVEDGRTDRTVALVSEFIGSATLAAETAPEEQKQGWRDLTKEWVVAFTSGVAVQGVWPAMISAAEAVQQITG